MQTCICLLENLERSTIITFNPSFWSSSSSENESCRQSFEEIFRDPEFYGGAFLKTSQKEVEEGRFL